jgi:phosphoserine phosphatase RsbU/P
MPSLVLIKGPNITGPGLPTKLQPGETILGRDDSCTIIVPNNAVSRQHAKIIFENGAFSIQDLNSRNKTFVNNREITEKTALKHDDRIKICDFQFLYQDEKTSTKARPPLPAGLGRPLTDETMGEEEDGGSGVVESTIAANPKSGQELLSAQPTDRLRVLLEISVGLSKTLELAPVLETIADASLSVFRQADRCFIILLEENKLIPRTVKNRRQNVDDNRFSKTIVRRCMDSQTAYLSEDASSDAAMGAAQSIAEFKIRSVMCVPIVKDGKALGAMQLDTQDRGRKFKEEDLKLLLIIANLAGVAIERAKLHENTMAREKQQKEIELAQKVQLGFLPKAAPQVEGYEFFHTYSAAQTVGGDYYDFVKLQDGRVAVLLGDVAGKGVPASLLMAKLSAEARFCMLTMTEPGSAVTLLNDNLVNGGIGDRFVTLAVMILDPKTHKVILVNAGHMNPIRYTLGAKEYTEAITNDLSGVPLGLMEGFPYSHVEFSLEPGECLLVFTDGVSDAMSPDEVMFESINGIHNSICGDSPQGPITRPKQLGERLFHAVRKHANGRPQNDDIAIVSFGRLPPGMTAEAQSNSSRMTVEDVKK